jgi:hypothetical protein
MRFRICNTGTVLATSESVSQDSYNLLFKVTRYPYLFVSTWFFAAVLCKIAVLVNSVNLVFGNKAHCSVVDPDPVGLGTFDQV